MKKLILLFVILLSINTYSKVFNRKLLSDIYFTKKRYNNI